MYNQKHFWKSVRVNSFIYDVYTRNEYGVREIILVPRTGGKVARSGIFYSSCSYMRGDDTYQAAVRKAKELAETIKVEAVRRSLFS